MKHLINKPSLTIIAISWRFHATYHRNVSYSLPQLKGPYMKDSEVEHYLESISNHYADMYNKWKNDIPLKKCYWRGITSWVPDDWKANPRIARKLLEPELQRWALHMNSLWLTLGRETAQRAEEDSTIISLPHGFMVSSSDHFELNYWDSYWILKGLLACEMFQTARNIIKNICHLVGKFGYVPKGGRYYYTGRSSPPLLAAMLDSYLAATLDMKFLQENIKFVEKELKYWRDKRTVRLRKGDHEHVLYHYHSNSVHPRIECYGKDVRLVRNLDPKLRSEMFRNLNSCSESVWTFSSRWCEDERILYGDLLPTKIDRVVPVDLNAIIHQAYCLLRHWYRKLGESQRAAHYKTLSKDLLISIEMASSVQQVLWNAEESTWFDYDIEKDGPRKYFYLSNLTPLWTLSYSKSKKEMTSATLDYLFKNDIDQYKGGVPVTKRQTGATWDFPNSNPGMQACLAEGLRALGTPGGKSEAVVFVQKLLSAVYTGYIEEGSLFEMLVKLYAAFRCFKVTHFHSPALLLLPQVVLSSGIHSANVVPWNCYTSHTVLYDCYELGERGAGTNSYRGVYGPTNGVILHLLDRWSSVVKFHDNLSQYSSTIQL